MPGDFGPFEAKLKVSIPTSDPSMVEGNLWAYYPRLRA